MTDTDTDTDADTESEPEEDYHAPPPIRTKGPSVNYGALIEGLKAQGINVDRPVVISEPEAPYIPTAERQMDQDFAEFEMTYPGGVDEFFAEMWDYSNESQLVQFGWRTGVHDPHSTPFGRAPEGIDPAQLVAGLVSGEFSARSADAAKVAEAVRKMGREAWLDWWPHIVKANGIAALDLAEKVHQIERERSRNPLRQAVTDWDTEDDAASVWLVEGIFEVGELGAVVGRKSSGKSVLIATDLAACIGSGTPFHGHQVQQGRVLVLSAEGTEAQARSRMLAWIEAHPDADDPSEMTEVWSAGHDIDELPYAGWTRSRSPIHSRSSCGRCAGTPVQSSPWSTGPSGVARAMAETLVTFMILLRKLDRMRWHERITIWKPTSRLFRSMGPTGRVRVVDYPGSVSDARHGTVAEATRFDPMTTFEQLNRT